MKHLLKTLLGITAGVIGLHILFETLSIPFRPIMFLWPVLSLVIAHYFYRNGRIRVMGLFLAFAAISFGKQLFGVNLTSLILAMIFLYAGYKLLKGITPSKTIDMDRDLPSKNMETQTEISMKRKI